MKKKIKYILLVINVIAVTIFINAFIYYYRDYKLNKELTKSKEVYISLKNDIEKYTKLKEEIYIINNEHQDLNNRILELKKNIESKNNSINNYNNRISELNNKISIITGIK